MRSHRAKRPSVLSATKRGEGLALMGWLDRACIRATRLEEGHQAFNRSAHLSHAITGSLVPSGREHAARVLQKRDGKENRPLALLAGAPFAEQSAERIVELVDDPLLQRDDGVIGDRDVFRTDLRAAFGDVAIADALRLAQLFETVLGVERMHLERRRVHEEAWTDELFVEVVVPQHVADVLAEEAFDALTKLLNTIDVLLGDPPRAVRRIRSACSVGLD